MKEWDNSIIIIKESSPLGNHSHPYRKIHQPKLRLSSNKV